MVSEAHKTVALTILKKINIKEKTGGTGREPKKVVLKYGIY